MVDAASAQEARLAVPESDFAEGFTGVSNVKRGKSSFFTGTQSGPANVSSGGVLVGLSLGSTPVWDVDHIAVALPPDPVKPLCFRASSLGGRFWSDNPYLPPADSAKALIGPLTRKYKSVVASLPRGQLVFRTALPEGGQCDDLTGARYLPALFEGDPVLTAHINSGGAAVASRLERNGKALGQYTMCDRVEVSSAVAADRVCRVNVAGISGPATLHLLFLGSSGKRTPLDMDIYVPAR